MVNLLEITGRETLSQLDYVGSLNIQWWPPCAGCARLCPWLEIDIGGEQLFTKC